MLLHRGVVQEVHIGATNGCAGATEMLVPGAVEKTLSPPPPSYLGGTEGAEDLV
jgi:hypothetical protein